VTNVDRGTSLEEAERQATAINAFWAERGRDAKARATPVYDHRGKFLSFGVESDLSLIAPGAPSKDAIR